MLVDFDEVFLLVTWVPGVLEAVLLQVGLSHPSSNTLVVLDYAPFHPLNLEASSERICASTLQLIIHAIRRNELSDGYRIGHERITKACFPHRCFPQPRETLLQNHITEFLLDSTSH
jgi:hypothetical protein